MLNPTNRTGLSTHISVTTHTKPKRTDEKGKKSPKFMHLPIVQTHKHTEATSTDTVIPKQTAIFILSISHFYALFLYQQSCLFVELKPKLTHKQKVRHFIFVHIGPSFLTHHSSTVSLSSFVGWWAASFYEYTT